MALLRFDWDPRKEGINRRRHRMAFDEASEVFFDEYALLLDDPDHSVEETRFLLVGMSSALRVLTVCHCVREGGDLIRIIGARQATRKEAAAYWERLKK